MTLNENDKTILRGMFNYMLDTDAEQMASVVQPTKHTIGFEKVKNEKAKYIIKITKKTL